MLIIDSVVSHIFQHVHVALHEGLGQLENPGRCMNRCGWKRWKACAWKFVYSISMSGL